MENRDQIRLHATVHGRVQGVSFRYFALESAKKLELSGWVRNRYDGTVETIAEGNRKKLEIFLKYLNQGSSASNVTHIEHQWLNATGEFSSFRIRMTV